MADYQHLPFRALASYRPRPQDPKETIALEQGKYGEILGAEVVNGWVEVSFGGHEGAVPFAYLQLGSRKTTERILQHDFPGVKGDINDLSSSRGNENQVRKVFRAVARAFKEKADQLPLRDDVLALVMDDNQREAAVDRILQDLSPEMEEFLLKDKPTLDDLLWMDSVGPRESRRGQYLRITQGFPDDDRLPKPYIGITTGATQNFWKRLTGHRNATGKTFAEQSVQEAKHTNMWIIGTFTGWESAVALAEQIFIEMFGTQHRALQTTSAAQVQRNELSLPSAIARDATKRWIGKLFFDVSAQVFEQLGWTCTSRVSTMKLGSGLNYESPASAGATSYSKKIWIRHDRDDRLVFQRAVRFHQGVQIASYSLTSDPPHFHSKQHLFKAVRLSEENEFSNIGLQEGAEVELIIEIMRPSSGPHPHPYSRLPTVGIYSDWHYVNTVGIKLQWSIEIDGQTTWWEKYIQTPKPHRYPENYAQVMGIFKHLMQIGQNDPRPYEDANFGIAHVKDLKFDWMTQTATIETRPPKRDQNGVLKCAPKVTEISWEAKLQRLRDLDAYRINVAWPTHPFGDSINGRKRCDLCFLHSTERPCLQRVDDNGNKTNQCVECHKKGWPCSWTWQKQITPAFRAAFSMQPSTAKDQPVPIDKDIQTLSATTLA